MSRGGASTGSEHSSGREAFERIAAMRAKLKSGLALFDDAAHDDPTVADGLRKLTEALHAFEDPTALRASVPAGDLERFDDELEELARLNAVLIAAAVQDREGLVNRLVRVRSSLRDLNFYAESGSAGARCDVSG